MHIVTHTLHTPQSLRHQTLEKLQRLAHCSGRGELEGWIMDVWSHPAVSHYWIFLLYMLDKSVKTDFIAVSIANYLYEKHVGAV